MATGRLFRRSAGRRLPTCSLPCVRRQSPAPAPSRIPALGRCCIRRCRLPGTGQQPQRCHLRRDAVCDIVPVADGVLAALERRSLERSRPADCSRREGMRRPLPPAGSISLYKRKRRARKPSAPRSARRVRNYFTGCRRVAARSAIFRPYAVPSAVALRKWNPTRTRE